MEKMIKDRIIKQMIILWSVMIIILAVLFGIIMKTIDFSDLSLTSHSIWDWGLVALFFVLLIFLIVATFNSLRYRKILNEFYIMNNMSKKAVEEEFTRMTEVVENFWVSPILTMYYDGKSFGIVKNAKLSKVNVSIFRSPRATVYYLELFNRDRDRIAKLLVNYDYQKILDYYRENCPHIALF
ncbi:MAG: hypothetical protein K6E18_08290 [Lachnospiraceae bacterium]|nr:hypothetical protein [Lachnospiraceae bacterium]